MAEGVQRGGDSGGGSSDTHGPGGGVVVDQAGTALFRASLVLQLLAAAFFGLLPFLAPVSFARAFNLVGDETFLYRLAGAATLGYVVPALIGLFRRSWRSLRIPIFTTFTFNLAATAASLVAIDQTGLAPLPVLVAAAAALFTAISAYWLFRNQGPHGGREARLEPGFRLTLIGGTVVATAIAVWQLCLPRAFADFFNVSSSDLIIIRLTGAATLGYGLGGLLAYLVNSWPAARFQTLAAITANAAAAIASAVYIAHGGRSLLGVLFFVASGGLVLVLTGWAARAER